MKKKNAFTLIELLAVIVILAVILVISIPRILDAIDVSKKDSFKNAAQLIADSAEKKKVLDKLLGKDESITCKDVAKISDDYGTCKITFDDSGVATVVINGKKGGKFDNLACQGTKDNMTCAEGEISTARKCTSSSSSKFVDGQYTYTYSSYDKGWSVALTDKSSTNPVTTELCGTINDKPIVSMQYMFQYSKATSIDVSSFDTSKVTYMLGMFYKSAATEIKGLENFDTSNVTDMYSMFQYSKATSIDVSSFDTSNVTDMSYMFDSSAATEIKGLENFDTSNVTDMSSMFASTKVTSLDLSGFDTSKVTDMSSMFAGIKVTSLDLSGFDTSKVTDMHGMFYNSAATSLDLSSFDTSKVTDMHGMFFNNEKILTLDVSSFDTSNVTNMSDMFLWCKATTGYARSQKDADRFNASSNKPAGLTFVVKSQ